MTMDDRGPMEWLMEAREGDEDSKPTYKRRKKAIERHIKRFEDQKKDQKDKDKKGGR